MQKYAFWNNKGGTGKTSLAFQTICLYAEKNKDKKILAIDLCPQANLSELFLGGLEGSGSSNLLKRQGELKRATIGGYFQDRLPSPYSFNAQPSEFITKPNLYNREIPENIDLVCGDPLLELQSNAVSTLANTSIPSVNTWIKVIDWVQDFLTALDGKYDVIFFDTNPSFSIYTQMALAATEKLILPVMADDSSKRAVQNAFSLIYGVKLPSDIYKQYAFNTKMIESGRNLPKVHLILKNRLTQYMGAASAYLSVLKTIDEIIADQQVVPDGKVLFSDKENHIIDVRDFQTTGVVAFARGCPFFRMNAGSFSVQGRRVNVKDAYLQNCKEAIERIVENI